MYKLSEIKELIRLVDQSSIQELEIENEGSRLFIRKPGQPESVVVSHAPAQPVYAVAAPNPAVQEPAAAKQAEVSADSRESAIAPEAKANANLLRIVSPMVGTFYGASTPGADPFVQAGDKVKEKTVVCIIEAMKLMNEIEAETKGEIVEVLVENGQLVEYGQPLFLVKPE